VSTQNPSARTAIQKFLVTFMRDEAPTIGLSLDSESEAVAGTESGTALQALGRGDEVTHPLHRILQHLALGGVEFDDISSPPPAAMTAGTPM